jgi:anti-anti-sigma factor
MERHHMKMAVGVITGSDGDALADGDVARTHTVFEDQRHAPALPADALDPRRVPGRMHTVVLTGSLDRDSAHQLETEIERLCEEGVAGITLDLRKLAQIEAIGVAVVAFRCRLCRRRGYEFTLIRGSRAVQLAFERAGLSERLPFVHGRTPSPQPAPPRLKAVVGR